MSYLHVDANIGVELIDMMNSNNNRSKDWVEYYDLLSQRSHNRHLDNLSSIYLVEPSEDIIEKIVENGGTIIDEDDNGYLFCVPKFWVVEERKVLELEVFGKTKNNSKSNAKENAAYVNMIIPTSKPTVICSLMSPKSKEYEDGHVFRYWTTYMLESKFDF